MSHAMMALITEDEKDEPVASRYCIRIEDFVVTLSIGAYEHERGRPQRVRVDLEMTIDQDLTAIDDRLSAVVSYDGLLDQIERWPPVGTSIFLKRWHWKSPISASRTPGSGAWPFPSRSSTFLTGEPCPASGSTWPGPAPGALSARPREHTHECR